MVTYLCLCIGLLSCIYLEKIFLPGIYISFCPCTDGLSVLHAIVSQRLATYEFWKYYHPSDTNMHVYYKWGKKTDTGICGKSISE